MSQIQSRNPIFCFWRVRALLTLLLFLRPPVWCNSLQRQQIASQVQKALDANRWTGQEPISFKSQMEKIVSELKALARFGEPAVAPFINALNKENADNREGFAELLVEVGPPAVPFLIPLLKDEDENVRASAAAALGSIGPAAEEAIGALIDMLNDSSLYVRPFAFVNLSCIGKPAIGPLINALRAANPAIRAGAARALGEMGPHAGPAVPNLKGLLRDNSPEVRRSAAWAFKQIGPRGKAALPELTLVLADQDSDARRFAATALGTMGHYAWKSVPDLTNRLTDEDQAVCESAALSLSAISGSLRRLRKQLSSSRLNRVISRLQLVKRQLRNVQIPQVKRNQHIASIVWDLDELQAELDSRYSLLSWIRDHEWTWAVGTYMLWLIILILLLWQRPLWVYTLNEKGAKLQVPSKWVGGLHIGLCQISLLSLFHYVPRVLDAWVKKHLAKARQGFANLPTVKARKDHVFMPVAIDGHTITEPTDMSHRFRLAFKDRDRLRLLIWGEGGIGKTSLACQLAKRAMAEDPEERPAGYSMLPVLIEHEVKITPEGGRHPLIEAIRGQVQQMTGEDEVSPELMEHLLKKKRVIVMVDHFSEMSQEMRDNIQPGFDPKLYINAMIVTSRQQEQLQGAVTTELKPMRIEGNRLSSFMEAYLTHLGKRELYDDPEFFDACGRLSRMVGDRNITVLLARLYADQMIAAKQDPSFEGLPENIPDLMLSYLNWINRSRTDEHPDNRTVQRIAKAVAWACLEPTFRPGTGDLRAIQAALPDEEDLDPKLKYLTEKLGIIRFVGPDEDKVRMTLDPLAEYLAGLRLIELYGSDEKQWKRFLDEADKKEGAPEAIAGFLLAVRDCCLAKGKEHGIPNFLHLELAKRADLDLEAVEKAKQKQRIQQLIAQLSSPDVRDRRYAARQLSADGRAASQAVPQLGQALKDPDAQVAKHAALALPRIGPRAKAVIAALIEVSKHKSSDVRLAAIWALGEIGPEAKESVSVLAQARNDEGQQVRELAAQALRKIAPEALEDHT